MNSGTFFFDFQGLITHFPNITGLKIVISVLLLVYYNSVLKKKRRDRDDEIKSERLVDMTQKRLLDNPHTLILIINIYSIVSVHQNLLSVRILLLSRKI